MEWLFAFIELAQEWLFLSVTLLIVLALIGCFLLNALTYGLNSGQLGRGRWWVFQCLWEEGVLQSIPGGMERKAQKLKEMVGPRRSDVSGSFGGKNKSWTYEELWEGGDDAFRECARDVFESALQFWMVNVILYLMLGPFVAAVMLTSTVLGAIGVSIEESIKLVSRSLQWNPIKS